MDAEKLKALREQLRELGKEIDDAIGLEDRKSNKWIDHSAYLIDSYLMNARNEIRTLIEEYGE